LAFVSSLPRVLILDSIAEALATQGWSVARQFVSADLARELGEEARTLLDAGALRPAGVGTGKSARIEPTVRGDQIVWLDPLTATPAQRDCLEALEALRQTLNRELQLGVFEFEGHFAAYPPGASYRRHRDRPAGSQARVVSCVLYLNHDWRTEDGGQLRLYLDESGEGDHRDVLPQGGTLVSFLSQRFWHEVLPATRARLSLTGWFRRRASL
jgi:SM-20-related protein